MQAAKTFMGCCTLLFGVEIICLLHLLMQIFLISIASSVEPIELVGIQISPTVQILNAAWALGGVPVIIGAGVGAVYRIESHLRLYYWYLVMSLILDAFWWTAFLLSGSICSSAVSNDVQRMGTAFVCGFTDTFVFFWMLIGGVISLYFIFIVWSAAEEIAGVSYPELVKYRAALRGSATPIMGGVKEQPSMGAYGGAAFAQSGPPAYGGYSGPQGMGGCPPMGRSAPPGFGGGMASQGGAPQSFIPSPSY